MTNEDAIKWLSNLKNDIGNPHYERLWPYAQAIEEICELLKEQEAVKPMECLYPHGTYACGFCDYVPIGNKDGYRANYCPECGRAVKWNADGA